MPPADEPSPRRPRVAVVCEARYAAHLQPAGLAAGLRRRGVEVLGSEDDLGAGDVLVFRGRSEELLGAAERAERRGVAVVNRPGAVRAVLDKVAMGRVLRAARLPVPLEWTGTWDRLCAQLAGHDAPLVVKPRFGDNGRDVHLVRSGAALAALAWHEPTAIVQTCVPGDGSDLKLYVAGDRVWAVRKASPLCGAPAVPTEAVAVTAAHRRIAAACRLAFGLELFGVDCVDGPSGPVVIEVNDFPNYSGLADADEVLARHVLAAARPPATVGAPS